MPRRVAPLLGGHRLQLLEGSREFFPALIKEVDAARDEVLLETYIFNFTGTGGEVALALQRAAARGVSVHLVVDGVGTPQLPPEWVAAFDRSGVLWRIYSPTGRLGLFWPGLWRRLHRKLCVVDRRVAFCGGINFLDDFHDPNHGRLEQPRLDFSVRVEGPLVTQVRATMHTLWTRIEAVQSLKRAQLAVALESLRSAADEIALRGPPSQGARAALLLRDNVRHRARIERAYRRAIGRAREEIIIANAYLLPGRKIRHALVRAAARGVRVRLLVHGRYEYFMQYFGARAVFGTLLEAGVEIYEYSPSFLHAKVAVIDGRWATVGSSNLDPLSLLLAREANVVVENKPFAQQLRGRLVQVIQESGQAMDAAEYGTRSLSQRAREWMALAVVRVALFVQGKKYL